MTRPGPKEGVKRSPYKKQADESTRNRVIAAADAGEDWIAVAIANGVNPRTARNWILRDSASLKKRGATKGKPPHTKLTNTVIELCWNS